MRNKLSRGTRGTRLPEFFLGLLVGLELHAASPENALGAEAFTGYRTPIPRKGGIPSFMPSAWAGSYIPHKSGKILKMNEVGPEKAARSTNASISQSLVTWFLAEETAFVANPRVCGQPNQECFRKARIGQLRACALSLKQCR